MTNTDHLQAQPDFFSSKEDGKSADRINSNPRYKFFKQAHFTAGDYEQFMEHWDNTSHTKTHPVKDGFQSPPQVDHSYYRNISTDNVMTTFEYIFHKFKKGIFFKIVQNELRVFLPFSKIDYTNEWSGKICADPTYYKNMNELIAKACAQSGHTFDPSRTHFMMDHWYANNGLVRYEYPISENDSGISTLRDMLITLTKERELPDGEYFLNKRDFPILHAKGMESYDCIYGPSTPLVSHQYSKYCPILGMTTSEDHADIPIPTWDDWARVSFPEKWFGKDFIAYPDPYQPDFHKKIPTAVFRGASTGMGLTADTNPRIFFSHLSLQGKCDDDGTPFLDCGITKWNCRPRRAMGQPYYDTFSPKLQEQLGTVPYMSQEEQAHYKYILHLPGHSEAYRLSMEMAMGSVILMYPCRYKLWFSDRLIPYTHYIPIDPTDPDDIYTKIRWCKEHEEECEKIAIQSRRFYDEVLSKEGILDYMQNLFCDIQKRTGRLSFARQNLFEFQLHTQKNMLSTETQILSDHKLYPFSSPSTDLSSIHSRTFQILLHKMDPQHIHDLVDAAPIIKQSRNVILRKIVVNGRSLCVKTPVSVVETQLTHECFVGQIGLNRIANVCPMILYTYGRWGDHVLSDYVEGLTFEDALYKQQPDNVCSFFLLILQQLSILLHYLQMETGFIHYDMYPWNIIIQRNTAQHVFHFPYPNGKSIQFCPDYYPVIIDFGKSHIVHKNIHFLNISPFHIHLHQDMISILISGLFLIIQHHKLSPKNVSLIISMTNYIGGTSYSQFKKFDNLAQIKRFLKLRKKYSNMLLDDKQEFRNVEPIRLFDYINVKGRHHNCFRILNVVSDIGLNSEVYYSRFVILQEICDILNVPRDEVDPYDIFIRERKKRISSLGSVNSFYRLYMDYHMTVAAFSHRISINEAYENIVEIASTIRSKPFMEEEEMSISATLPRFFSHPNIRRIQSSHPHKILNHFADRRKVVSIITHALSHISTLKISLQHYTKYTQGIQANMKSSISNHLALYLDYLSADD